MPGKGPRGDETIEYCHFPKLSVSLITLQLPTIEQHTYMPHNVVRWFPVSKKKALSSQPEAVNLCNTLAGQIHPSTICIYTDGSRSPTMNKTSNAVHIPAPNVNKSWTLTKFSSIFLAKFYAIYQARQIIFNLDGTPSEIILFSDSSSSIQAIQANQQTTNDLIPLISEIIDSLKSSSTLTSLAWIPSHTGVRTQQATSERIRSTGNMANYHLSPSENVGLVKKDRTTRSSSKTAGKNTLKLKPPQI
jgi:hypothetical protein